MLYLHETIDIIGTGQEAYLGSVGERARHSESEGISRLVGTWKVIGSTHRWPRVVNLWEMDGWQHWAAVLERQFLPDKVDRALAPWWARTAEWRSGGFDRILEPAPYSPTRRQLADGGLRAWVCAQTTFQLHPGRAAQFLAAYASSPRPALEALGLTLLGAYSAAMRSDEAVVIWAAPDFRALCAAEEADAPALATWRRRLAEICSTWETLWMVPSADCFFHPQQPS